MSAAVYLLLLQPQALPQAPATQPGGSFQVRRGRQGQGYGFLPEGPNPQQQARQRRRRRQQQFLATQFLT